MTTAVCNCAGVLFSEGEHDAFCATISPVAEFQVMSSDGSRTYAVQPFGDAPWCMCRDHTHRQRICKHIRQLRGEDMTTPNTAIAMRERYTPAVMDGVTEAVLNGDLKGLPPAVKIEYYNAVCHAVGIDPMARPFEYIPVRGGKEKLYWTAVGAFTLGAQYGASIEDDGGQFDGEAYVVRAIARAPGGRMATNVGRLHIGQLKGQDLEDAKMKAVTKAQRRAFLTLCGVSPAPGITTDVSSGEIIVQPGTIDLPSLAPSNAQKLRAAQAVEPEPPPEPDIRENVVAFIDQLGDLLAFQQSDFDGMAMTRNEKRLLMQRGSALGIRWSIEASAWEYVKAKCADCGDEMDHPGQLVDGICALCAAEQAGIPATPDEPDDPASGVPAAAELDDEAAAEAADQSELLW